VPLAAHGATARAGSAPGLSHPELEPSTVPARPRPGHDDSMRHGSANYSPSQHAPAQSSTGIQRHIRVTIVPRQDALKGPPLPCPSPLSTHRLGRAVGPDGAHLQPTRRAPRSPQPLP
jgi:hypothetical protein